MTYSAYGVRITEDMEKQGMQVVMEYAMNKEVAQMKKARGAFVKQFGTQAWVALIKRKEGEGKIYKDIVERLVEGDPIKKWKEGEWYERIEDEMKLKRGETARGVQELSA